MAHKKIAALGAVCAAALLAQHAAAATTSTISFSGLPTDGPYAGNGAPFSTYSEAGYTVSAPTGQYVESNYSGGTAPPGLSIITGANNGTQAADLTLTGNGFFNLLSFDALSVGAAGSYMVNGFAGSLPLFTFSGTLEPGSSLATINNPFGQASITRVEFNTNDAGQFFVDNIQASGLEAVSAAPEPGTWLLMLGGVAMCGYALRRRAFSRQAPMSVSA